MKRLDILNKINDEIKRAEALHPEWPSDLCEQVLVVSEEMGEAQKAVLQFVQGEVLTDENIDEEMIQVAAMAVRFLMHRSKT